MPIPETFFPPHLPHEIQRRVDEEVAFEKDLKEAKEQTEEVSGCISQESCVIL